MKSILKNLSRLMAINFMFFTIFTISFNPKSPVRPKKTAPSKAAVSPTPVLSTPSIESVSPPITEPDPFAELQNHNSQSDCWIQIEGRIYDITSYFGSHPGGSEVLVPYCGLDATGGFATKNKSPGVAHSAAAVAALGEFLIK